MPFTEQFPILKTCTYLNTAFSGLLPKSSLDWRRQHDEAFFETGSEFRLAKDDLLQATRSSIARFFHGAADLVYLTPNFSFGFNTLLEGLAKPQRFLLLEEDYPSINQAVKMRGHICYEVKLDEHLEQNLLQGIEQFKPTVLAFSVVQYISGIKTDLNFIKEIKNRYPDLLIIADGTQYCGTAAFSFEQSGLDVLMGSGYKWLLSGYGNGFVMLKEPVITQLYNAGKSQDLSIYFEPGHLDTLALGSLNQGILLLEQTGISTIEGHIRQLSGQAKAAFTERGLLTAAVIAHADHSSIFNLQLPVSRYDELQAAGIRCAVRGTGIRVSFHYFNTGHDLQRLLQVIDDYSCE